MRHRWYDDAQGRFITRDPAGYVDGLSLYLYARGYPIIYYDPYGNMAWAATMNAWPAIDAMIQRGAQYVADRVDNVAAGAASGAAAGTATGAALGAVAAGTPGAAAGAAAGAIGGTVSGVVEGFTAEEGETAEQTAKDAAIMGAIDGAMGPILGRALGVTKFTRFADDAAELADDAAKAGAKAADAVENAAGAAAPAVKATGQEHHAISKAVHEALEGSSLRGVYTSRDPRWATRALDADAHKGYQQWHRELDREVAEWIQRQDNLTQESFERYLRERYAKPDLANRFPNGLPNGSTECGR